MSNLSPTTAKQRPCVEQQRMVNTSTATATDDLGEACQIVAQAAATYSRKHPAVVMLCTFVAGCYVGWKVKPW